MGPKEVIQFAKKNGAIMVDLKFMDFPGMWQHFRCTKGTSPGSMQVERP